MFDHTAPRRLVPGASAVTAGRVLGLTRAVAFWLAVALPFAYLPLALVAPAVLADPALLVSALSGNLVALAVGHGHEPSLARRHPDR